MCDKILIIDDQLGIRRLLREVLESAGFEVVEACNGLDGVAMVQSESPAIVLLDLKMPGIGGQETLQRIRHHDSDIPVLIMSAYGDMNLMRDVEKLGVSANVTKPFDIVCLVEIITALLAKECCFKAVGQ